MNTFEEMNFRILVTGFFLFTCNPVSGQWQPVTDFDSTFYAVYFTDDITGYICGEQGILRKTVNAGSSWTSLTSGSSTILEDVKFVNDSVGFVCSYNGHIYKTLNRGQTWNDVATAPVIIYEMSFPTDSLGYVISSTPFSIGRCYKTTDQGSTWQFQSYLSFPADYQGFGMISGIDFPTTTRGYAIADGKILFTTLDGGLTWTNQTLNFNADVSDIDFVNADTGFISNSDGFGSFPRLYETTNGGVTWDSIKEGEFSAVYFLNEDTGYIGLYSLDKTMDGGLSWTNEFNTSPPIVDFAFPSDSIGYALSRATFGPGLLLRFGNPSVPLGTVSSNSEVQFFCEPNPFQHHLRVRLSGIEATRGEIEFVDIHGFIISDRNYSFHAGVNEIFFSTEDLPTGVYLIKLKLPQLFKCIKVLKSE